MNNNKMGLIYGKDRLCLVPQKYRKVTEQEYSRAYDQAYRLFENGGISRVSFLDRNNTAFVSFTLKT